MTALRNAWATWVGVWGLQERPHAMVAVRVLVALVLLWDFLYIEHLGLTEVLFTPQDGGGLPNVDQRDPLPELYTWFERTPDTARMAWGAMVLATAAVLVGFATPLAALSAALISSQLGQVLPLGDRGIDMMLRNVLVLLAFSPANRAWSVDAWLARRVGRPFDLLQPAWARHLLVLQVAGMYFLAGVQKTALAWTPFGGFSALYSVLQDPAIARHDFAWLADVYPVTQVASAATMVFEYTAGLLPLVFWYRHTWARPGRLRAWSNRVGPLKYWLSIGILLHLGIAATMQLGIFPWAMLALYPALVGPPEKW